MVYKNSKRRLRYPAKNAATLKYIETTKNQKKIHKASDKSPIFGFLKIYQLLKKNLMDRIKYLNVKEHLEEKLTFNDRLIHFFARIQMFGAIKGMVRQFQSLSRNSKVDENLLNKLDSQELWQDLQKYASTRWGLKHIGFTEIPQDLIFHGRHIQYMYALVFIEEMCKERIDDAPHMKAGYETLRVYNHLGQAVLDIGKWLQNHGIRCQPNHPLGGLVSYVPLAGKAGLGWRGLNGLLINPQYGQRLRIAPIYLEKPLFKFTDSTKHSWIENYCPSCRLCQKECPPDAIQQEKTVYNDNVPTIGQLSRSLDPIKCYPQFSKWEGCSICMKVCPFSQSREFYKNLRLKMEKSK